MSSISKIVMIWKSTRTTEAALAPMLARHRHILRDLSLLTLHIVVILIESTLFDEELIMRLSVAFQSCRLSRLERH